MNKDAKIILLMVSLLIMIGIVMIYSSSAVYAYGKYADSLYFVKRHFAHLAFGLIAAILCMSVSVGKIADSAKGIMAFFIILLIAVLVPGIGKEVGGARRWMHFLGFGLQPSEMAKFALIIYLADLTSRKKYLMQNVRYGFLPPLFIIGLVGGLIFIEPDMGTSISILFIGFIMLFVAGARLKHLMFIAAGMLPALCLAVIYKPYRIKRILTFFNP